MCRVDSCMLTGARRQWFLKQQEARPNFIGRLSMTTNLEDSVSESELKKGCPNVSHSSSGMMNWTIFAFLTQYMTVCDEPALMKMQLTKWGDNLAFDLIPGSHATQAVCSVSVSEGGHVEPGKHYQITQWILEHDLLKYPHVKSSLYAENDFDKNFWDRPQSGARAAPSLIKPKIESAMNALQGGYAKFKMLERGGGSGAIKLEELRAVSLAFFGTTCSVLVGFLLEYGLCIIRERLPFRG